MCDECNGTGEIMRTELTKKVMIVRPIWDQNGFVCRRVEETVTYGGADICPTCRFNSEVEYQALRT